ncbi:MAG: DUF1844 domain-containing protein [Planctomycetota bacterium]|jgi:hypothetical protein
MSHELPEPSFEVIISTFAAQAAVALGQVPNPMTGKEEVDLVSAKFAIDLLQVLEEKSRDNCTEEEGGLLNDVLAKLRLLYVDKSGKAG